MTFAQRYPALFHVADRAALDGIRRHGLLSARRLVAMHGGDDAWLRNNREGYRDLAPGVSLRRQGMRDGPLRPRLDPSIGLEEWRWFINGFVFLFSSAEQAEALRTAEPTREQVVLRYDTASVIAAGAELFTCRFNNGYIDRAPVINARRRRYDDYRRETDWVPAQIVREVAVLTVIPPEVDFTVCATG